MPHPIDASTWPSARGPWPEVTDLSRLFDHGQLWCSNAAAHPEPDDGYPDAQLHRPWNECQTGELFLSDACEGLDGDPLGLSAYGAAQFRFGQPRTSKAESSARIVLETWSTATSSDSGTHRVSLPPGEALRLARLLEQITDQITFAGTQRR